VTSSETTPVTSPATSPVKSPQSDWCKDGNCDEPLSDLLINEIKFWNDMLTRLGKIHNGFENILTKHKNKK